MICQLLEFYLLVKYLKTQQVFLGNRSHWGFFARDDIWNLLDPCYFYILALNYFWHFFLLNNRSRCQKLNHFRSMFHFYTPWKRQKTSGVQICNIGRKWISFNSFVKFIFNPNVPLLVLLLEGSKENIGKKFGAIH